MIFCALNFFSMDLEFQIVANYFYCSWKKIYCNYTCNCIVAIAYNLVLIQPESIYI